MNKQESMSNENITVSVVMPTLNAERTIERALMSIRSQTIPQECVEILVIDGGSTDRTREIAAHYGAVIIENLDVIPERAKSIGLQLAKGDYLIKMDADEYFVSADQIMLRLNMFQANPDIKCILTDRLLTPRKSDVACAYLNDAGDPFSYFVYQLKGSVLKTFQKNELSARDGDRKFVLRFGKDELLPIGDGGASMVDMRYIRATFAEHIEQTAFASTICNDIIEKTKLVGCMEGDDIIHDSSARFFGYLRKLKFRVINNIHNVQSSGFSARADFNRTLNKRKYLYPIYCLTLVWPIFDAIYLSITRRNATYLLHIIYVYYVMVQVCLQTLLKLLNLKKKNIRYG
jgi:glycosyltransferase involved in cell wall biosynthesis